MKHSIALRDVLANAAYITVEVPVAMKLLKQCCICRRILMGTSARTGLELWQECDRVLPVSHGLCPECAAEYRERAALADAARQTRTA